MHPDKQLAGLLGLTDARHDADATPTSRSNTATRPRSRDRRPDDPVPRHAPTATRSTARRAVATLYSNATTATANPAVTLRSVGSNGGQAAAFTYDLARSVVYTRQGNPAWAGQERDGVVGIRPDDLFYGAKSGDVQPDWLDTSKIAIPQADEQQRLLVNLITQMERDKLPLPHFWYLPRGLKAAIVMSGDDHADYGGTAATSTASRQLSPPGCVGRPLGVRPLDLLHLPEQHRSPTRRPPATPPTASRSRSIRSSAPARRRPRRRRSSPRSSTPSCAQFTAKYTEPPGAGDEPHPLRRLARLGLERQDRARARDPDGRATTTTIPGTWIGNKPGFLNGGGFPMRFADLDGTPDRRLPGEHEHDRRGRPGLPGDRQHAARQRARPAGLLRRLRHQHAHRLPATPTPATTRSSPRLRRAACRSSPTSSC